MAGRFECASSMLDLVKLLRKGKMIYVALGAALVIHPMMAQTKMRAEEKQAVKPLTTKFVKRQPRLTKPLEMKKRPRPKRRQLQRRMVAVEARVNRQELTSRIQPLQVVGNLAKPQVAVMRAGFAASSDLDPTVVAAVVQGTKETGNVIDMSLEMVDIDALDTGQYHAMVIQDPHDKQNITGFFYMYVGFSKMGRTTQLAGLYYERPSAFPNLMNFVNEHTDIRGRFAGRLFFSDDEIMKAPFLYTSVDAHRPGPFKITDSEALHLHNYMRSGGFWFVEDAWPSYGGVSDRTARRMIIDAFAAGGMTKGRDWEYQNIPNEHAINHSFYDFNDGPPTGLDVFMYGRTDIFSDPPFPIEMAVIDGRVWCIMSNKDYEDLWALRKNEWWGIVDVTRQFMFGVNLIVFALTQEGGITHRLMAGVQY